MRRVSKSDKEDGDHQNYSLETVKERLEAGRSILYRLKYEGSFLVSESRGVDAVRSAFKELRKTKEERRKHGIKHTPIKNCVISINSVSIRDPVSQEEELSYAIRSISYIVNDEKNRSYIGMIAQIPGKQQFECTILKNDDGKGRDIVHILGIAFDLAYDENLKKKKTERDKNGNTKSPSSPPSAGDSASEKKTDNAIANDDVSILKSRLQDLAVLVPPEQLKWYLNKHNISEITELPKRAAAEAISYDTVNLIETDEKPLPAVGRKLENLVWNEELQTEARLGRRRSSTSAKTMIATGPEENMLRKQEEILLRRKISDGGTPFPKVNPPPRSLSKRQLRHLSTLSLDDPFDMGDFNAVSFPEFDEFYTNLNESDNLINQ